jgi:hypothetical protein
MHNGLSSHCKKCHNAAVQDWRERNGRRSTAPDVRLMGRSILTATRDASVSAQRGLIPLLSPLLIVRLTRWAFPAHRDEALAR